MSSSPPDISTLSLHPQQRLHDPYEYDRTQFHFATTPAINISPLHSALKSKQVRSGLPSQWIEGNSSEARSLSPHNNSDFSSAGGSPPLVHVNPSVGSPQPPSAVSSQHPDDEIIPTAIVIKNIPFNVKRETLLDIITSLSIPTPYAFNYHLDQQGSFRGLAFANFRQAADADAVVAALNGFDVQGRKLRVEYKKVLQAGEKERIEREKALRRMRSMQLEKEQQQQQNAVNQLYEDYGTVLSSFSPQRSFSSSSYQQQPSHYSPPGLAAMPTPNYSMPLATTVSPPSHPQAPATPSISEKSVSTSNELDLNDPSTLEIYSRILLFKDDKMRDELAFSRTLTAKQRRVVHLIAQKLGVYHYSVGEGDDRYAVVTKIDPHRPQPQPQRQPHTLSRAPSAYLSPVSPTTSTVSSLRVKKSMPDLKTLHQQAPRLTSRASNGNIREGYATIASPSRRVSAGFGSLFSNGSSFGSVPPVPNLPSAIGSSALNGTNNAGTESAGPSSGVVRQPRGPGITGFNRRDSRVVASESQVRVRTDSLTCDDGRSGNGI